MTKPLQREYEYFLEIREDLAKENDGKYVAIKGQEVLGIYDDYMAAANAVYVDHERGTVLMQEISIDPEALALFLNTPNIAILQ